MTSPDPRERGLDPAHILRVCELAAGSDGDHPVRVITTAAGVRVAVPSRKAAGNALAALIRLGYQAIPAASGGRGRALLVTGWSPAGLDARLAAMRTVVHQLGTGPDPTASAAIIRVRRAAAGSPASSPDTDVLAWAGRRLRALVSARSGIHAPHNPDILPADPGNALRLRAAWIVEAAIDDLIERHLRVAGHALHLFVSLRERTSDDRAQDTAIRQAGIAFHLSGSAAQDSAAQDSAAQDSAAQDSAAQNSVAQDSSALIQRTARRPDLSLPPSRPDPAERAGSGPARAAASGFPTAITDAVAAANPASSRAASPGGRHFPARRPGLTR